MTRRKLTLAEWAEIGEVIGMVAVVVSLLLVVYSINQNTQALRGATDNLLFEQHAELQASFITDESMAAILAKLRRGESQLTAAEAVRWEKYRFNLLDIWAMAFMRYRDGLMGEEAWQAWNTYFQDTFTRGPEQLTKAEWDGLVQGFPPGFWEHVQRSLGFDGSAE